MKFEDLCLNLQYDFGKMNSTLGSVVPLAMFLIQAPLSYILEATPSYGLDNRKAVLLFLSHFKKHLYIVDSLNEIFVSKNY